MVYFGLTRFYDREDGGFFMTAEGHDPALLARVMEDGDNVEPCASSVFVLDLLRLEQFTGRKEFRDAADKTLRRFGPRMKEFPPSLPVMLSALDLATSKPRQVVIAGDPGSEPARAMVREVHERFLPAKLLIGLPDSGAARESLVRRMPFLKGMRSKDGLARAYVCVEFNCKLPVDSPDALGSLLDEPGARRRGKAVP